jgi:predicted RNase H-like nuclease (RuvC/YqgF family)
MVSLLYYYTTVHDCSRSDTRHRKIPWRLSPTQKLRQRRRLRAVDKVVETLSNALAKKGETLKSLERWKAEMPTEAEMLSKDKYTMFDRKEKRYRKGIHSTSALGTCDGSCGVYLTFSSRTSQVDACVAEGQPSRILNEATDILLSCILCTIRSGTNGVHYGILVSAR